MISMASNGHFCSKDYGEGLYTRAHTETGFGSCVTVVSIYIYTLTQIPQPMHSSSEMNETLAAGLTSMQSFPVQQTSKFS